LGLKNLYIKNDAVNMPTLSFKDRVVSVALTRAKELGFTTVSCASTGNLANSTAAIAAHAGLDCCVFIPSDLEAGKILGTLIYNPTVMAVKGNYDQVNRLCSEVGNTYGWGFVNINLRPYYSEGSKTLGFEVAEQLGWKLPDHIVAPLASGSLFTKIYKGFQEFIKVGLVADKPVRFSGAQAEGCSPIAQAFKEGRDFVAPVKPNTIAKSIAIVLVIPPMVFMPLILPVKLAVILNPSPMPKLSKVLNFWQKRRAFSRKLRAVRLSLS